MKGESRIRAVLLVGYETDSGVIASQAPERVAIVNRVVNPKAASNFLERYCIIIMNLYFLNPFLL